MKESEHNPVFDATLFALKRCEEKLDSAEPWPDKPKGTGYHHLKWMCHTLKTEGKNWPIDKASRWLGFIQGILCLKKLLFVEEERNETRKKFHEAYQKTNNKIPKTVNKS